MDANICPGAATTLAPLADAYETARRTRLDYVWPDADTLASKGLKPRRG